MPRLELTFSESKFAACQSGTLSRVSRAFRIPDIDSRAKCVRSIKLSLIPNPNTPRKACFNPFTATGYVDIPPPRWPTFLVTLFPILKEGMGLSLLDEFEVQYHVIKK